MEYVAVAFRSRSETVKFFEFLRSNGFFTEIVNTPKEAGVGCGLSVKIPPSMIPTVKKAIKILGSNTFAGFFLVKTIAGRRVVKSV